MMGLPSNDEPGCFWQADLDEAARELVAVIREVRPQVMVTYDDNGFYGHPDHIQAHRVAWRAFQLAADASPAAPVAGGQVLRDGDAALGAGRGDQAGTPPASAPRRPASPRCPRWMSCPSGWRMSR